MSPQGKLFWAGFLLYLFLWILITRVASQYPITKKAFEKAKIHSDQVFFLFNLAIVAIGMSLSVFAITITSPEGNPMTPEELHQMAVSAFQFVNVAWLVLGMASCGVVLWGFGIIGDIIRSKRNPTHAQGGVDAHITSDEMKSILERKEVYTKVKREVDDFLKRLENEQKNGEKETNPTNQEKV